MEEGGDDFSAEEPDQQAKPREARGGPSWLLREMSPVLTCVSPLSLRLALSSFFYLALSLWLILTRCLSHSLSPPLFSLPESLSLSEEKWPNL